MNEAQVRTLDQVRQVVAGTQALEFRGAQDDEARCAWIGQVLSRFGYGKLGRTDKGVLLAYLQRLSGYSRAQVTRSVARWAAAKPLVKNYRRPAHAFARRNTPGDVSLLADVDRAVGPLSGPAKACVLRRQRDVFKVPGFERVGDISVAHLYSLRNSAGYRAQRVVLTKATGATSVGGHGPLRVPRCAHEHPGARAVPTPRQASVAPDASAPQSKGQHDVGTPEQDRR